eukprot:Lithocolla_globosa_v1_NODE_1386_length_2616_cov_35.702850.p4 type:complete len:114 gc:universal NODE_1386_length_2616_cov_35.702850:194-535(+)
MKMKMMKMMKMMNYLTAFSHCLSLQKWDLWLVFYPYPFYSIQHSILFHLREKKVSMPNFCVRDHLDNLFCVLPTSQTYSELKHNLQVWVWEQEQIQWVWFSLMVLVVEQQGRK